MRAVIPGHRWRYGAGFRRRRYGADLFRATPRAGLSYLLPWGFRPQPYAVTFGAICSLQSFHLPSGWPRGSLLPPLLVPILPWKKNTGEKSSVLEVCLGGGGGVSAAVDLPWTMNQGKLYITLLTAVSHSM